MASGHFAAERATKDMVWREAEASKLQFAANCSGFFTSKKGRARERETLHTFWEWRSLSQNGFHLRNDTRRETIATTAIRSGHACEWGAQNEPRKIVWRQIRD